MNIPKDHIRWVTYWNNSNPLYTITSDPARQYYYLWKVTDNGYERLGKSKSSQELIDIHHVEEEIRK